MAEGKAAAQAEAAEWKRKYELETAHKQQNKIKGEIYASLDGSQNSIHILHCGLLYYCALNLILFVPLEQL